MCSEQTSEILSHQSQQIQQSHQQGRKLFNYYIQKNIQRNQSEKQFFYRVNRWRFNSKDQTTPAKFMRLKGPLLVAGFSIALYVMVCPVKTLAVLLIAGAALIFHLNIDTSNLKDKIFGTGTKGKIKYYIFLAFVAFGHFEYFSNGYFCKALIIYLHDLYCNSMGIQCNSWDYLLENIGNQDVNNKLEQNILDQQQQQIYLNVTQEN
ncbi:hypothetical protein PPERSA_11300 [Pseudocohnilembus persalinus]|uniref:Uncharacterized protein n=1 Tax=Pseudocohnilembus persalinus TaxID=266149 RepID=A0A0V0QQ87_PSEPJ|nr:hypothetical protein PPERSA_11300 [Pseudocohnilembus persalinus]|eukprot:KRX04176.1 hypothetical protein PPERSA_11300 [Pseudocohnilembus persalinus]